MSIDRAEQFKSLCIDRCVGIFSEPGTLLRRLCRLTTIDIAMDLDLDDSNKVDVVCLSPSLATDDPY